MKFFKESHKLDDRTVGEDAELERELIENSHPVGSRLSIKSPACACGGDLPDPGTVWGYSCRYVMSVNWKRESERGERCSQTRIVPFRSNAFGLNHRGKDPTAQIPRIQMQQVSTAVVT